MSRNYHGGVHYEINNSNLNHGQTFGSISKTDAAIKLSQEEVEEYLELITGLAHTTLERYVVNQTEYLQTIPQVANLEDDGRYFWILRNMDYINWLENLGEPDSLHRRSESISALIVCGSRFLEGVASQVFRNISKGNLEPVLHFFWKSCQRIRDTTEMNLIVVCTLLSQLIGDMALHEQFLVRTFFRVVIERNGTSYLNNVSKGVPYAMKMLLEITPPKVLWDALISALQATNYICETLSPELGRTLKNRPNLTLIFHVENDYNGSVSRKLIHNVHRVMVDLRQFYKRTRMMVTCESDFLNLQIPGVAVVEYDRERKEIIQSLAVHNTRHAKISTRHDRTCDWLEQSPQYKDWISSQKSGLLLIEGKPGSGKSTLTRYCNDHLLADARQRGCILANFFYSHRDGHIEKDHCSMLRSLLWGILESDESFFIHFQQAYRHYKERMPADAKSVWDLKGLKTILYNCVHQHLLERKIFLVVDALDEGENNDRKDIVGFMWDLVNPTGVAITNGNSTVKIFLASRPIIELGRNLLQRHCNHIILQRHNQADIYKYTRGKLDIPLSSLEPVSMKEEIFDYISENAEGVFLWVYLVTDRILDYLEKGLSLNEIRRSLKSLPTDLENLYVLMLYELQGRVKTPSYTIQILRLCIYPHRGLTSAEMEHALAMLGNLETDPDPKTWELEKPSNLKNLLINFSGNFVELKWSDSNDSYSKVNINAYQNATVQVMHQTVHDFFVEPHEEVKKSKFAAVSDGLEGLRMIQRICVRYLRLHYEEVQQKFHSSEDSQNFFEFCQYLDSRPLIEYSIRELEHLANKYPDLKDCQFPSNLVRSVQNRRSSHVYSILNAVLTPEREPAVAQQLHLLLYTAAESSGTVAFSALLAASMCHPRFGGSVRLTKCYDETALNCYDETVLNWAATHGNDAIVRMLVDELGFDPSENRGKWDRNALHCAASAGHSATVRMLVADLGADVNAKDLAGSTVLHHAVQGNNTEMARILVADLGVDVNAEDCAGFTALGWLYCGANCRQPSVWLP
ncbi:hypothetical protein EDC01DRAFT_676219 [Geopyxis carbonaria]|nr:hypothetical protein EDC01DRAFT_676219 [Geopyxis carbonaria]